MRKIEGFENLNETLPVGPYIVEILEVNDHPEKEYLELTVDIAEGEHLRHFTNIATAKGSPYVGYKCYRFYKARAIFFFKKFITSIEKSNAGYKWEWNEKTLVGKKAVAVFCEEEYVSKDFEVKTRLAIDDWRSIDALKEGRIETPAKKLLSAERREEAEREKIAHQEPAKPEVISDQDLPF